jgi:hypothetical protein
MHVVNAVGCLAAQPRRIGVLNVLGRAIEQIQKTQLNSCP